MSAAEFASFWDAFEKLGVADQFKETGKWFLGRHDLRDIITLKSAGWKPENCVVSTPPMSWFWRKPIRPGTRDKKGQRFMSTGQALSELRRMEAKTNPAVGFFSISVKIDGQCYLGTIPAKGPLNAQRMADSIGATIVST